MSTATAHAKINLGLVVGPLRDDGKHEVVTVLQRVELGDELELEPASELVVEGFPDDTIVRAALESLALEAGVRPGWRVRIEKNIPVAAGLGGGSSDAAAALRLANAELDDPVSEDVLHRLAAALGADVPYFLCDGTQLARGDGTDLRTIELPLDYHVVLVLPDRAAKDSTAAIYGAFDERDGAAGFDERVAVLERALQAVVAASDLARLPPNDLARSPAAGDLEATGAFRADVSGAGPAVYGLFEARADAERAAAALAGSGRILVTRPTGPTI